MTDSQKRAALLDEAKKLEDTWRVQIDALDDDDALTDAERARLSDAAYAAYAAKATDLRLEAFWLQFPRRRGWFSDTFILSLGVCADRRLSVKQTEVCKRYCVGDADTWRTSTTYCRAGDYKIKLVIPQYSNGIGYITII